MVLWKFFPGKLPPGKFPPIKLHPPPPPSVNPPQKNPIKFPLGIVPPISLIRRYYKRLCFSLNPSLCPQTGGGGSVQPFPPGRQCLISPERLMVLL